MKSILINESQNLKEIKDAFTSHFPHLKIEFFSEKHKEGEASSNKMKIDDTSLLKDIRTKHTEGALSIDGHQKTSTFETNFFNHFGVTVQVLRKSGNLWLQTTTTDDWSLAHQEKTGQEFDA